MPDSRFVPNSAPPEIEVLPSKKRRGGQAGNQNATKHGIYSRQLPRQSSGDDADLSTVLLGDEIVAIRVFIRRLVAASADLTERGELVETLHELSLAMLTLTRLVRTQLFVNKDQGSEMENLLKLAIEEASQNWK